MDTKLLLPNRYKRLGWFIFVPCLILTILSFLQLIPALSFFDDDHILSKWTTLTVPDKSSLAKALDGQSNDFAGEILMTLTALGFFFVAFSRERTDDEWIMRVRLESLLWAFYVHLGAFLLSVWLSYDLVFYAVLSWNMLTAPLVFLARFHWIVYMKPYLEERRATA
jgi:ABC-type glycerol-3-phosphate transport system permease component